MPDVECEEGRIGPGVQGGEAWTPSRGESPFAKELKQLLDELPENRINFARAYVQGGCENKTRAAVVAGYARTNAAWQGTMLTKVPEIARLIELLKAAYDQPPPPVIPPGTTLDRHDVTEFVNKITPEELVDHMAAILRATPFDFLHVCPKTGAISLKRMGKVTTNALRAARKVTIKADGTITVEMHDKLKVIEGLARRYGLYKAPAELPAPELKRDEPTHPANVEGLENMPDTLEQLLEDGGVSFRQMLREMVVGGHPTTES